uniref:Uncharacterized protein n=1 Tax=Arundo donax TaxID=35708 RepID=A0A0A9G0L8_ARUDO
MQFVLGEDRSLICFVSYPTQIDQKGTRIGCSTEDPCPTLDPPLILLLYIYISFFNLTTFILL